jgi:hypothetical protein
MSYSDFNNAYQNINHKLLETFDGITTEDLNTNTMPLDYTKVPINYINNKQEELNGTSLRNLNDTSRNLNDTSRNSDNNKLTHRECIELYLDPVNLKNPNINIILRHLSNCSLCQNEIKRMNELFEHDEEHKNMINQNMVNNDLNNKMVSQMTTLNQTNKNLESENKISLSTNELETLLKNVLNKEKKVDEYDNFNRILKALEDKNDIKPFSIEINFINVIICLFIILLIIDIILRFKFR